jgi:hypothetical protein
MATLPKDRIGEYYHFDSIEEMQAKFPHLPKEYFIKPDNDF